MAETGKVLLVDLEDEMRRSYIDYAMSVIVGRALPDVRDGLKPVHRRILYAMYDAGMTPDKPHKKSARVVGDVMARFHPHGDSAIYDSMVRMAQDFATRYPLVDGHGNFGSIDGDAAAAMRYTEARLSPLALELLRDIEKDTVDFIPNYDESQKEPAVLPSKVPNLLINGSSGIAVGMATNIPPHNLREVVDALVEMIDNPDLDIDRLLELIPAPDFPTGGLIVGRQGVRQAYLQGRGTVRVRARVKKEVEANHTRLIVNEIPYQVNKANLVEKIAGLVKEKKIEGITDLRDESDRNGMRIVIEIRKDTNARVLLNQLYKHTQMEDTFGIILLALVDGQPRYLSLKEMLSHYLTHQEDVVARRCRFELRKAEERAHIVIGLRIAIQYLDEVIRTIRRSPNTGAAREALMSKFGLSEKQAQAVLDMRLQKLTGLERENLEKEYEALIKEINRLKEILANPLLIRGVVREEILAIRDRFADERRTGIVEAEVEVNEEDLVAEEEVAVTITRKGYIKRIPVDTYQSQKRGGKGKIGVTLKDDDVVEHLFICNTHDYLLFFTTRGRVHRLKVYEIPEASRQARGLPIVNLLEVGEDTVTAIIPIRDFSEGYLFMATAHGIVKRTPLSDYNRSRRDGIVGLTLETGDTLVGVAATGGHEELMLVSGLGKAIRFRESEVRSMGRTAKGVRGMTLDQADSVVALLQPGDSTDMLVVTELGYGKRTPLDSFHRQTRAGKGVLAIRSDRRHGLVVSAKAVNIEDEILIVSSEGEIIRLAVNDIPRQGRNTQGVMLKKMEDQKIVAVALA